MRLQHLALEVRDQQRAIDFYARFFRFDPGWLAGTPTVSSSSTTLTASRWGSRLPTRGSEVPGSRTSGSRWIRATRSVVSGNVWSPTASSSWRTRETEGYVGFKCLDPDRHVVEVAWEP
jgi:catechol 2,3-dioxygenase-like lactoylglutathione lyase family enzyme